MRVSGLEFPSELLYSRDFLWVQPADEAVTFGFLYHAVRQGGDVYYCRLPKEEDHIEKGLTFGFVEGPKWVKELIAPFSGKIEAYNRNILVDSTLINRDPYGRGWLLKVIPDHASEIRELMGRDEAVAWYDFVPELESEGFRIAQSWVRGKPWCTRSEGMFAERIFLHARLIDGLNERFTPRWEAGDSWDVRMHYTAEEEIAKTWRFEVLGEDRRGDREVVRLRILDVSGGEHPHCFVLEVVKDSFALLRIVETGAPDQEAKRRLISNPYGDESWFRFETGEDCILDFPKLPPDCEDETKEIQAASAPSFSQYTSFYGDNNYMQIQMYGDLAGDRLRCTQYWERGLPWWKEAKRDLAGKELIRGELILEASKE